MSLELSTLFTEDISMPKEVNKFDIQPQVEEVSPENSPYGGFAGCWPGDGSGMDDLADYNQMEGGDI